jgi:hypothetical protein
MEFKGVNLVVKQLLTEDEIKSIYKEVENSYNNFIMERLGQQVFDFRMPESVMEKILEVCKKLSGQEDLILEAYQFARYEKFVRPDGVTSIPKLAPHHDTFDQPRFTFDYQLGSNISWSIFVEGEEIVLSDNDAVTFSGTHQVHWRPVREWIEGEYIDMIFCHLHSPSLPSSGPDHNSAMLEKAKTYRDKTGLA